MNIFHDVHKQILKRLREFDVNFMLIGGYAVNFHGYNRATGDMDLWLKPDNENRRKFIDFLKADGFDEESIMKLGQTDFTKHTAFHIGEPPLQIDLLTIISNVDYREAENQAILFDIGGTMIAVIPLQHLIQSKLTSGRPKDRLDVEELQRILKLKN